MSVPQLRANAASANTGKGNGCKGPRLVCRSRLQRKHGLDLVGLTWLKVRFGEIRCIAEKMLLRLRANAASAIAAPAQVRFVRSVSVREDPHEWRQSVLISQKHFRQASRALGHLERPPSHLTATTLLGNPETTCRSRSFRRAALAGVHPPAPAERDTDRERDHSPALRQLLPVVSAPRNGSDGIAKLFAVSFSFRRSA